MEYSADVSTLAASPTSTFVRPYGPCTQVDIGLAARVDTSAEYSILGWFCIFTTYVSVHFVLCALFIDKPEVFLPKYSQTAILHGAHFWRVVYLGIVFFMFLPPIGISNKWGYLSIL